MSGDPFTEVLNSIWDALENYEELTNLVKVGNRIKLGESKRQPYKQTANPADFPEVAVEPAGGSGNYYDSSDDVSLSQDYRIVVTGRNLSVNEIFFPVKWAVIKAVMLNWANMPDYVMTAVPQWDDTIVQQESGKGFKWSSVMTITVNMNFDKQSIE